MAIPLACTGDTTDIPGMPGTLVAPQNVIASLTTSVLFGGRPVATVGAIVAPHGNYTNPKAPGFNPECGKAKVVGRTSESLLIEGKPAALWTSLCSCGHFVIPGPKADFSVGTALK